MKSLFHIILVFQLLTPTLTFAQYTGGGMGSMGNMGDFGGMGGMPAYNVGNGKSSSGMRYSTGSQGSPYMGSGSMGMGNEREVNFAYLPTDPACPFEPSIPSDDAQLLSKTQQALADLAQSDQCRAIAAPSVSALQRATAGYTAATGNGGDNAAYNGQAQVNCSNYEVLFNNQYKYFLSDWNAPADMMATDPFMSCRGQGEDEAKACAENITATYMARKSLECKNAVEATQINESAKLRAEAYASAIQGIQALLADDKCMDLDGSRMSSLVQTGLNLAGRASTLGLIGGPAAQLVGFGADLIGSLVSKVFKRKTYLDRLQNEEDMTKLACLYNKIEDKSRRCERIAAQTEVARGQAAFDEARRVCDTNATFTTLSGQLEGINAIIAALKPVAAAPAAAPAEGADASRGPAAPAAAPAVAPPLTTDQVNSLAQSLIGSTFPGTQERTFRVLQTSLDDTIGALKTAIGSPQAAQAFFQSKGESVDPLDVPSRTAQLRQTLKGAESAKKVFDQIQVYVNNNGDAEAIRVPLEAALKEFNTNGLQGGRELKFAGVITEVLNIRAAGGPDSTLTDRIRAYNSGVQLHAYNTGRMTNFNRGKALANRAYDDNGDFEDARLNLGRHLETRLRQEMNRYVNPNRKDINQLQMFNDREALVSSVTPGAASPDKLATYQNLEEKYIWPQLRACNQLQSSIPSTGAEPYKVCRKFAACADGIKQFPFPAGLDPSSCASNIDCRTNYDKHICHETAISNLRQKRNKLKNEFLTKGTLCGQSMQQFFDGR